LCRYFGLGTNQTPKTQARVGRLEAERLLSPRVARSIGGEFNDLRRLPRGAAYSCPSDEGAILYAIFSYASEPAVPVEVELSGCRFARNGQSRAVAMTPRLLNRLLGLTRSKPPTPSQGVP
jgi:hypothetical protein